MRTITRKKNIYIKQHFGHFISYLYFKTFFNMDCIAWPLLWEYIQYSLYMYLICHLSKLSLPAIWICFLQIGKCLVSKLVCTFSRLVCTLSRSNPYTGQTRAKQNLASLVYIAASSTTLIIIINKKALKYVDYYSSGTKWSWERCMDALDLSNCSEHGVLWQLGWTNLPP